MKKTILMSAAMVAAIGMTSCKSSESAYKKAYEQAQEQAAANAAQTATQTTTPVTTTPVTTTPVATTPVVADNSNVSVRKENVSLVSGTGLKTYSVVVGSFGVQANAVALQAKLKGEGNDAQVVKSPSNMYRVIISTHDDKAAAVASRNNVRARFADSWLLYNN